MMIWGFLIYRNFLDLCLFVLHTVKLYPTTTLWEFSKLINDKYKIKLSDHSIYNILHQNKITRKKLRSKYYPEEKEGQEKEDLEALLSISISHIIFSIFNQYNIYYYTMDKST